MGLKAKLGWLVAVLCLGLVVLPVFSCDDDEPPAPETTPLQGGSDAGTDGAAGGVHIEGLSAPVRVAYDEHGIPHLTCHTDEDCVAALGYVHASNRFFTMDFIRHLIRGQLGGMVSAGALVLESDYFYRHFMTTPLGEPLEEAVMADMSPEVRQLLERYADGVNAWIEDVRLGQNGAELSVEYGFSMLAVDVPRAWEPEDTIAVAIYMMDLLGNTTSDELIYADMVASLPADLAADLLRMRPPFADFTVPASGGSYGPLSGPSSQAAAVDFAALGERLGPARGLLRRAQQRLSRGLGLFSRETDFALGSNNWVVAGSRTTSGNALLANDPHLGMTNPAVFLIAEVDSKSDGDGTIHVAGGTIPGLPVVLTGHNEDVAWGVTTVVYDLNEVYLEELSADGTEVLFEGSWIPLLTKDFTFANAAGEPVTKTFKWVPHHGPVIEEDPASQTAISVRWVLQEGMPDVASFMGLNRATDTAEVPGLLADLSATDQSFVILDRHGDIGWYPMAKVPDRPWASPALPSWAPVPGDGSAEWSGFIAPTDLPQLTNPPAGFIATANQDLTGATADGDPSNDGHPVLQGWDVSLGVRMHRIVELIEQGGNQHSPDTMLALQADTHSSLGEVIVPPLLVELAALPLTGAAADARAALESWQHTCPTGLTGTDPASATKDPDATAAQESIGCLVFHTLLYQLLDGMLGDEQAAAGVSIFFRSKINLLITDLIEPAALQTGGSFWDDIDTAPVETRADIMLAAITEAAALLEGLSTDPDDWRWGRQHTLTFTSIYQSFGVGTYNNGPFVNDGALYTVDVAPPLGKGLNMAQQWGPTVRIVIEARPDRLAMKLQHSGGTSLDRDSPFYDQLIDRYLRNEPIDVPFGPGAVPNPAIEQIFEPIE